MGTVVGANNGENAVGAEAKCDAILRSVQWCLTSGRNPAGRCEIPPGGIAHTFAVNMVELADMARGNGKGKTGVASNVMPKFVDVKLTQEDKADFLRTRLEDGDLILALQSLCDDGYRVGCSWSGEQQAYTVSLTCRDPESPNNGLCMTSFARDLSVAVGLAVYKHVRLTGGVWLGDAGRGSEDFG